MLCNKIIRKVECQGKRKILDFSFAQYATKKKMREPVCNFSWRAPEVFAKAKDYSFPVDMYALGHIFMAMFVCNPEHEDDECRKLLVFTGR